MTLAEPIEEVVTQDGQVPQGALFISIKNTGNKTATVNGVSLEAGEARSYSFVGKAYKAIPYKLKGTKLRILRII